jgi:hypothetical protein
LSKSAVEQRPAVTLLCDFYPYHTQVVLDFDLGPVTELLENPVVVFAEKDRPPVPHAVMDD